MCTRRDFLKMGMATFALSALPGCAGRRAGTAVAIGWDPTASTSEAGAAQAAEIERFLAPRYLDGPVAVAHVCSRPQGHLLLASERPTAARVKAAFEAARQPCHCGPSTTCGSDVAIMLRVLVDFLARTPADRRVLLVRSDLVPDPCKVSHRKLESPASVIIPAGIETHVYGVRVDDRSRDHLPQASIPLCVHLPGEAVDARHLGFVAGAAL